jgi:hypothetical protein
MRSLYIFIVLLVIPKVLSLAGQGFDVLEPQIIAGSYQAGRLTNLPQVFNVTGTLVQANPFDACKQLSNAGFISKLAQNESVILLFQGKRDNQHVLYLTIGDSGCSYSTQFGNIKRVTGIQGAVMIRLDASVGSGIYSADYTTNLASVEISK